MTKKPRVTLSAAERDELAALLRKGKADVRKLARARVLLQVDESESGPGGADEQVAQALNLSVRTVERVRERFVEQGLAAALPPKPSARRHEPALDGAQEARLLALACGAPPGGKRRWTLRLLAGQAVELKRVGTVSHETVRQTLKKNELRPHLRKTGCIPPRQSAEFVCHREDVLEACRRAHDPRRPVVCMDETSQHLIGEVRDPLPVRPGEVERYDAVYARNGVANLLLAFEPLAGWRQARITGTRRRTDWAHLIEDLLEGRHRDAERVVLAIDQLNTHSAASLTRRSRPTRPAGWQTAWRSTTRPSTAPG